MEIILLFVIIGVMAYFAFSGDGSKKKLSTTALFRRVWSSSKAGMFEQQQEAIEQLLNRYEIRLPKQRRYTNIEGLGQKVEDLLVGAADFDMKNPRNFGIRVAKVIAIDVGGKLQSAGINDYDEQFEAFANIDIVRLTQEVRSEMKKNGLL